MGSHVVVAPDKFKGSLGAAGVAGAVADGLRAAVPGVDVREHPVADGGDGTVEAALSAGYDRHEVRCTGPTGERQRTPAPTPVCQSGVLSNASPVSTNTAPPHSFVK